MIYPSFTWDFTNTIAKITNDSLNTKHSHIPILLYACVYACVHIWVDICEYMYVCLCVCVCICVYVCGFSMQMNV